MKRIAPLLAALLLLCSCAARDDDGRTERIQERYASAAGFTASVETEIERGEERDRYLLDISCEGEETRVTVREPEMLAGISAIVGSDGTLDLDYEGMVLDAGSLAPDVSAVNATSIVLGAVAEGYATERSTESFDEYGEALRLCFETEHEGTRRYVTAYFNDSDEPLYAEIEQDGSIAAYLRFTDFALCDRIDN